MDYKRPRGNNFHPGGGNFVRLNRNNQNSSALQADTFPFAVLLEQGSDELNIVKSRVNQILGGTNDASIPSPLPGTLARRDLPRFLRDKDRYHICEKSDGERALMYCSNRGCFLINRKFQIQKVNNDQFSLYTNIASDPDMEFLIDGEVIENYFDPTVDRFESKDEEMRQPHPIAVVQAIKQASNVDSYLSHRIAHQRFVYCMFDVAYYGKEDVQDLPLDGRLAYSGQIKQRVKEYLLPVLREKFPVTEHPKLTNDAELWQFYIWNHATLRIETKDFQLCRDMRRPLRSVIRFPSDQGFLYVNYQKQLKAKNDGFIFTPVDNNYMMTANSDLSILKYKWPGLNTIDFHIIQPYFDDKQQLVLFSHGYGQENSGFGHQRKTDFEFARIQLSQENREYVLANVENVDKAVVETNYDAKTGRWSVKHLRTDKHKGNFFSTVLSCMEAMIDNLLPDELEAMLRK